MTFCLFYVTYLRLLRKTTLHNKIFLINILDRKCMFLIFDLRNNDVKF